MFAHAQSALGTGAAYVALLVIAYERFHSPFAITAVLLAELLPAMALGTLIGAAADRWPRKRLLIAGDVLRAGAFVGLAFVGSIEATLALALVAGLGQAAFAPTLMAALPSLVHRERLPAATSAYGALEDVGYTAGPILAAAAYVFTDAAGVLLANGVTFALSAIVLATLAFPAVAPATPDDHAAPGSLLGSARDGIRALASHRGALTLVLSSTAFVCFLGAVNVGQLLLVRDALGGTETDFAFVVCAMGLGFAAGSVLGAAGADAVRAKRLYLAGLLLCGLSMAACGLAPTFGLVLLAFVALGVGNGLALVSDNLLIQHVIPDALLGRVFGIKHSLVSWAFAVAYFGGGALAALLGPRALFLVIAAGCIAAWGTARAVLRGWWEAPEPSTPAVPAGQPA